MNTVRHLSFFRDRYCTRMVETAIKYHERERKAINRTLRDTSLFHCCFLDYGTQADLRVETIPAPIIHCHFDLSRRRTDINSLQLHFLSAAYFSFSSRYVSEHNNEYLTVAARFHFNMRSLQICEDSTENSDLFDSYGSLTGKDEQSQVKKRSYLVDIADETCIAARTE